MTRLKSWWPSCCAATEACQSVSCIRGRITYLFRFAFVISFRKAGPSKGLSSSNAHNSSSDTLFMGVSNVVNLNVVDDQTSCTRRNCRILQEP